MDWKSIDIFEFLGRIVVLTFIMIVLFGVIAILLGYFSYRTDRMIFPRAVLFVIDLLYSPMRRVIKTFRGNYFIVDHIAVKLRNGVNYQEFIATTPEDRVLIVPQCMRHLKCPAKMSSTYGFECRMCGLCGIGRIAKIAKAVGTPLYVSPGGTFSKRILRQSRPRAVIGVACSQDLYEGTLAAKMADIPSQGVALAKTGCVETFTNEVELAGILLAGVPQEKAEEILSSVKLEDYEERAMEEEKKARSLEDLEKLKASPLRIPRRKKKNGKVPGNRAGEDLSIPEDRTAQTVGKTGRCSRSWRESDKDENDADDFEAPEDHDKAAPGSWQGTGGDK